MAVHRDQIEVLAMAVVGGLTPGYDENGCAETWPVRLKGT